RRIALRSVLSAKCIKGELKVLNDINLPFPKTKVVVDIIRALKIDGSVLVVTEMAEQNIVKSVRNLPRISATPAALLNVGDMLSHGSMIMTVDAARKAESIWGPKDTKKNTQESV
ncbi:50S ribosomal protein L4, partial [Chloroflexota bacterium]